MMQLAREVYVDLDTNAASFVGVDMGPNITRLVRGKDAMEVLDYDGDVLVFFQPRHSYFAARWTRGHCPAHYKVYTFEAMEPVAGKRQVIYRGLRHIADIPVRRGAVQTS